MAMSMSAGFAVAAMEAIDTRILLTKAQMLAANIDDYPDIYFAYCIDDDSWYKFDYNATALSAETGHFFKIDATTNSMTAAEMAAAIAAGTVSDGMIVAGRDDTTGELDGTLNVYDASQGTFVTISGGGGGGITDVTALPAAGDADNAVIYRLSTDGKLYTTTDNGTTWGVIPSGGDDGKGTDVTSEVTSKPSASDAKEGVIYKDTSGNLYMKKGDTVYELALAWEGTQAQYDAIATKDSSVVYYIID